MSATETSKDQPRRARLICADVHDLPLTQPSHPGIWTDGGWPTATAEELVTIGGVGLSVWEMTTGVVADIENDEYLLIVAGTGVLRFEDGETVELSRGALVQLQAGNRTEWTVLTTIRAVVISSAADRVC